MGPSAVAGEAVEARFLAEMRERIAWQADAADRARRGLPPQADEVLELRRLERAAEREPDPELRAELRGYVRALRPFADDDGRLPEEFADLVGSVFG